MNQQAVRRENLRYKGTMGGSQNNFALGFWPAFRDMSTGRIEYSRFKTGLPAPVHLIEGLPVDWAVTCAPDGTVMEVKPTIICGFIREGRFYTRDEVIVTTSDDEEVA